MMKRFSCYAVLLMLLLGSCRKREVQLIDSSLLRNAITVKDGSYFVYRDSVSGEIDSFVVEGYTIGKWEVDHWLAIEKSSYYMYAADRSKRFLFAMEGKDFQNIEFIRGYFDLDNSNSWKFTSLTNPQVSSDALEYNFIEHLSTYPVQGINYSEVYVYTNMDTVNYAKSYYSAANGLIKLEIKNNHVHKVYELLRQNIIK